MCCARLHTYILCIARRQITWPARDLETVGLTCFAVMTAALLKTGLFLDPVLADD